MRNERADERTRTADLISLRVIGHALHGLAGVCKSLIDKPVPLLCLAQCCTVLRSQWCQSGVNFSLVDYASLIPMLSTGTEGLGREVAPKRATSRPTASAVCKA